MTTFLFQKDESRQKYNVNLNLRWEAAGPTDSENMVQNQTLI